MALEDHLFFLFTQVVYRRTALQQEALKPLGLMPTEYRVLSSLYRKGPLSMQALAQWTAYERTRLTHMLHSMEANGWVERTSSANDRRAVVVQVTPAGEALFAEAKGVTDALTDRILEDNTPEEIAVIRSALQTMRERLIRMEAEV